MKAKDVPIGGKFKSCTSETKLYINTKTIKEVYHEGLSFVDKFKPIVSDKEKFKLKITKNYSVIFLMLIFGLGQKLEAQTGKIDPSFNPGGVGANGPILTTPIQPDGKILLGGSFTSFNGSVKNSIVRVDQNGTLDPTFNGNFDNVVNKVIIQPDGNLIVVGNFNKCQGTNRKGIARISSTGVMESALTFNPGNGPNDIVNDAVLQSDGKILIAGGFNKFGNTTVNRITRLNSNGILDGSFNPPLAANKTIYSLGLQADGKIIVGGAFTQFNGSAYSGLVRITATGTMAATIDPTFTVGIGFVGTSTNTAVRATKIQGDGKIIVGGLFESYDGFLMNNLIRLNSDGTRDLTFLPGTGANNTVNSITLQADGKIIIGGDFTAYNGTPCNHIVRLKPDGSVDVTFKPDNGANNSIYSSSIQADKKLIIGGNFTSYDGVSVGSVTRLLMTCLPVTASVSSQNISCNGLSNGSATITASGGSNFTYFWSPSGGSTSVASGLAAGDYTCVVFNDCGNSDTVSLSITEPSPISLSAGASSTICGGATASLSAGANGGTGSITYNWMPGNLNGADQNVTPSVTTNYTVTATDANACTSSAIQMVVVNGICPMSTVLCGLNFEKINSYSTCKAVVGATNYRFKFYDNITDALVAVKTQTSNYIYFNTVAGLSYNKTYKWTVAVENGFGFGPESNNSCLITFNAPQTTVLCGLSFAKLNSYSTCQPITNATNYRFRFYDENDNLMVEKIQPSNYIYFNTVSGLNYGKTYKWTVEVEYNDPVFGIMYGPASSNSCTITFNAPQTTVPCGNTYAINGYSGLSPVSGAISYRWSFYDATTDALVATKTGTNSSPYVYFNQVSGLIFNTTYKWTVEVQYNNGVSNVFGPPSSSLCTMNYGTPSAITIDETNPNNSTARLYNQLIDNNGEPLLINLFPNPTKEKITVEASEAIKNIMVYNISGQLMLSFETTNEADLTSLKAGLYFVTVETENNTKNFKIIKE